MDEGRRRVDQRNKSEAVQMTQIRAEGLKAETDEKFVRIGV